MNIKYIFTPLLLLLATTGLAQQLVLSDGEIAQLAIEFVPVTTMNRQAGSRFPATVIHSPNATSVVNSHVAGTLIEWHANPGDALQANAAIASIRSSDLLEIQNRWLTANSGLQQANFALERDQQLFALGIVAEQRLQETRRNFEQAQIQYNSLAAQLHQAGFDQDTLEALRDQGAALGIYQVRAPVAGVLAHRAYTTGAIVTAYSEVASLQQDAAVWLAADIPARLAAQINPGFELSLASGEALLVRQKDLVVNEATQTVEVLAEFVDASAYMPGQILTLLIPPQGGGVLVPAAAVVHSGDVTTVFVRTPDGVESRDLVLEPAGANYLARAGIRAGESLAVRGTAILKGMQLGLGQSE